MRFLHSPSASSILFLFLTCFILFPCIHAAVPVDVAGADAAAGAEAGAEAGEDGAISGEVPGEGGTSDPYEGGTGDPSASDPNLTASYGPSPVPVPGEAPDAAAGIDSPEFSGQETHDNGPQTPFSDEDSSEFADFVEHVSDLVEQASSLLSLLDTTSSSASSTPTANLPVNTNATATSANLETLPSIRTLLPSACEILSTIVLACASASPAAWGIDTSMFNTATTTPTPNPTQQASCACYSSSYFVPDVWNAGVFGCGTGVPAAETGLCRGPGANVRGWSSAKFGEVTSTSSVATHATPTATPWTNGGLVLRGKDGVFESVMVVAVAVVLVGNI